MKKKFNYKKLIVLGIIFGTVTIGIVQCRRINHQSADTQTLTAGKKQKEARGARSNPAKLNEPITYTIKFQDEQTGKKEAADLTLTIEKIVRGKEAFDYLKSVNEHNQEPPKNMEWFVLDVSIKMAKQKKEVSHFLLPTFDPLNDAGYKLAQKTEALLDNDSAFGFKSLTPEKTLNGKVAKLTTVNQPIFLQYMDNKKKIFFDLSK